MKKIINILFFLYTVTKAFSQQDPQFSQNMFNHMFINPGYAGANDAICASLLARQQWVGFKGAAQGSNDPVNVNPRTYLFNFDAAINPFGIPGGIGFSIMQDQLGFEKTLGLKVAYALRFKNIGSGPGTLGIGVEGCFLNKTIDFTKFIAIQPGDPLLNPAGNPSAMAKTFACGLWYNIPNTMYVGLSANQLIKTQFNYAPLASPTLTKHFYLEGGGFFDLNRRLNLQPSILIKSDLASTQLDVNCLLKYDNRIWGGLSYRLQDAVVILLGFQYGAARIGYSYDITTSAIGAKKRSGGSHEIFIGYCFKMDKVIFPPKRVIPESYSNDRFLWSKRFSWLRL